MRGGGNSRQLRRPIAPLESDTIAVMAATAIPLDTIPSIDPATGKVLAQIVRTSPAEVPQIVLLARAAQSAWAAVPIGQRCAQLHSLRERMMFSRDALADAVVAESGKPHVRALGLRPRGRHRHHQFLELSAGHSVEPDHPGNCCWKRGRL